MHESRGEDEKDSPEYDGGGPRVERTAVAGIGGAAGCGGGRVRMAASS